MKRLTKALFIFSCFSWAACTPPETRELNQARGRAERGEFKEALFGFDRVIKRAPESQASVAAAREGARVAIFDTKDYRKAATYLQHVVLSSSDANERQQAQKQLAALYFEHLQDYSKAIIEYNRLQSMNPAFGERMKNQLLIARANYYQANFGQAESEVNDILRERLEDSLKFETMILKGNILIARKLFGEAASIYNSLLKEFPERAKAENVALQLAVCYEEDQNFRKAIDTLELLRGVYQPPEYIELRIKRLQERQKNQPGAKGYGRK